MNPNKYQELAMRTSNKELDKGEHVINGALGLCGEAGELMRAVRAKHSAGYVDNVLDEVGDVCWYLAELCTALGVHLGEVFPSESSVLLEMSDIEAADAIAMLAAKIADAVKKAYMQGHHFDRAYIKEQMEGIAYGIEVIAAYKWVHMPKIMERNIEKLKKRFPDGFSAERSINREAGDI